MTEASAPIAATGIESVESRLTELASKPVAAHVEVYEDVHATLQQTLAVLDEA